MIERTIIDVLEVTIKIEEELVITRKDYDEFKEEYEKLIEKYRI